ncbi:cytochrome c-type biogenesis protein CcmH [Tepidamorphus sp. 3E244]|uniref:cytochrome c-type biogenesis protein n=1 Tax=Tepidamorphus sp. 3E244 TaxID=3385498 RepID=UPI0038FCC40C
MTTIATLRGFLRHIAAALVIGLVSVPAADPAFAVQPDEILQDAELEARAREISAGLRCLVCQNQSIDDSDAPLARDLRILVRERLQEGDSNEDVIDFVVERYGEYVLLSPRLSRNTILLWLAPAALLLLGALLSVAVFARNARRRREAPVPLSAEEEARIEALLNQET